MATQEAEDWAALAQALADGECADDDTRDAHDVAASLIEARVVTADDSECAARIASRLRRLADEIERQLAAMRDD